MSAPATAAPARAVAMPLADLPPGSRAKVEAFGRTIALFNVGGRLHALDNRCPHHGGPLCAGTITGAPLPSAPGEYVWGMQDRVLQCPWHGWEFDLESGAALFDPRRRVRVFGVSVEDGQIVLHRR